MIFGFPEELVISYVIFGVIMNFLISLLFGLYITKNIGIVKMMQIGGEYRQPWWLGFAIFIPFLKMGITLYRIYVLQIYFLNQGRSHQEFFEYLVEKNKL